MARRPDGGPLAEVRTAPAVAAPDEAFAAALRVFGPGARPEPGIVAAGDALVFPPFAASVWVPLEAGPGAWRLAVTAEGAAALRVELLTDEGPFALPLVPAGDGFCVRFALEAPVAWLRLAPVEAGRVRFSAFFLAPVSPWRSLLPDWRLGPLRLPFAQAGEAPVAADIAPPSWDPRFRVTALENLSFDAGRAVAGTGGALRLAVEPPLSAGTHLLTAEFRDADGAPAWVAPRLHLDGAAPNTPPAAHFRRIAGARYVARLDLEAPASTLVFQPRQERGAVVVEGLSARRLGFLGRLAFLARLGWRHGAPRLLAPIERLVGADPARDGALAALLRLLTPADLRYRRSLRAHEAARIARWLARPALREAPLAVAIGPGPGGERAATRASLAACDEPASLVDETAEADLTLPAGTRLRPYALAAIARTPPGAPPVFDTDRRVLGLRTAPHFRAAAVPGAVPLVLARRVAEPVARPAPAGGGDPRIAVVTATKDAPQHLARFLATLRAGAPARAELVLVDNATTDPAALDLLAEAETHENVRVVRDDRPFNFAALNNLGASLTSAEFLVFANNDLEFRYAGWAQALIAALGVEGTGVAGALLDYPGGRVQHAGIVLAGEARVRHMERFSRAHDVGYFGRRRRRTLVTAVTGALMAVRRDDFHALGGFSAARYPVLYNDVDLCLRARRAGLASVLVPDARAIHHESVTFGVRRVTDLRGRGGPLWRMERAAEADRFRADWGDLLDADPCYPAACDPVEAMFRASE